jgi:hypothetical protein
MSEKLSCESFLQEIGKEYKWFCPVSPVIKREITTLVNLHQERLRPFGYKNTFPCQLMTIWPGKLPRDILRLHAEARKSVSYLVMDNTLGVLRDVAITDSRVIELDNSVRQVHAKTRSVARRLAIEGAGLSAKATLTIPMVVVDESGKPKDTEMGSDLDTVEKAVEDAAQIASWYISWQVVSDLMEKKKYQNPFAPLMDMFKRGLWPIGAVQQNYVVLVAGGRKTEIIL